jgi:hypothetical protein
MCDQCYGIYPNCPICGDDEYIEEEDFDENNEDLLDDEE